MKLLCPLKTSLQTQWSHLSRQIHLVALGRSERKKIKGKERANLMRPASSPGFLIFHKQQIRISTLPRPASTSSNLALTCSLCFGGRTKKKKKEVTPCASASVRGVRTCRRKCMGAWLRVINDSTQTPSPASPQLKAGNETSAKWQGEWDATPSAPTRACACAQACVRAE